MIKHRHLRRFGLELEFSSRKTYWKVFFVNILENNNRLKLKFYIWHLFFYRSVLSILFFFFKSQASDFMHLCKI